MAGPVCNNTVSAVNINHWPTSDGYAIAAQSKLDSFVFINDFTAAGYGVCTLRTQDVTHLGQSGDANAQNGARSVKVVIGPGTGLGQGILVKNDADGDYEPYPAEGGHTDFTVKD